MNEYICEICRDGNDLYQNEECCSCNSHGFKKGFVVETAEYGFLVIDDKVSDDE